MPRPSRFSQRLTGRTALITGAGSPDQGVGIGKAIATVFAAEGARVCVVDRDGRRAEKTVAEIVASGGDAIALMADVTDSEQCLAVVSGAVRHFGSLDTLVNNVGLGVGGGPVEAMDEAVWDRVHDVNVKSSLLMCKHALPELIRSGRSSVVNIASIAGLRGNGGGVAYGSAKAALIGLTRNMAVMYGRQNVRVNAIAPGHMFTPLVEAQIDGATRELRRRIAPLGIEGDAWDIALTAAFLASDEARFITAVCIPVDGGVTEIGAMYAHRQLET
jgi:NAD(P)-dependent dehydrogenase (short-subunit alcohol dehydrogenase family)